MSMNSYLIDRFIAWLTLFSGLSISIVAIYYSVAGLVAIFAAAAVPIIIMGVTLEVSKLIATLWLKWNWSNAPALIKTYLTVAVVVLMFITSMGIFGFLSKAHIDQTASSVDSVARVSQIEKEISRQNALINRAEDRLKKIETSGVGVDANIQSQIDTEQSRIDSAYQRVQPAIDEQQRIIDSQTKIVQDQLVKIDRELATLQGYIDTNDIHKAQAMVGTRVDGQYGPATAAAFQNWQAKKAQERNNIIARIESSNTNPTVKTARDEIQRIRQGVESQITQSNELVNRLRSQLGQTDASEVDKILEEQRSIITTATTEIDRLTIQKYELEAETRKLEAEVGPIKFIADFIYGDRTDKNTLEEAVRWMILIIVAVFDPLAIVLLLASQHSFQLFRKTKDNTAVTLEVQPTTVEIPDVIEVPEQTEVDDHEVMESAQPREKRAMQRWKAENLGNSLKHQRRLLELGQIEQLPWEKYINSDDHEAAIEAAKWAEEQLEESKKKELISWMEREGSQQIKKSQ